MSSRSFLIPSTEHEARLNTTRKQVRELGYAAILAVSGYAERDGNVCYLCGHKNAFPYSTRAEAVSGLGFSALLVPSDGDTTLIAPLGYQADAVRGVGRAKTGSNFASDLADSIRESSLENSKIAIAGSDILPVFYVDSIKHAFPGLTIEFRDEIVAEQRMIKSENEIRLIREASRVADKAVRAAVHSIKPGMKESAIGSVARKVAMDAGADYIVRDRIQSGPEMMKGIRWPFASKRKVRKGELVSIDFIGWVNSYGFDIQRTACVGRPSKGQRALIELSGDATKAMSEALTDNGEVEDSIGALKQIEKEGISTSPFGHSIGLEIVENPYLFPGVRGKVRKGMVFCVEPQVRSAKAIACTENEVLVTSGKPEVITRLPIDFWK